MNLSGEIVTTIESGRTGEDNMSFGRIALPLIGLVCTMTIAWPLTSASILAASPHGISRSVIHGTPESSSGTGRATANQIRRALGKQEGAGPGWCARYGGYRLGAHMDGVYACGPSTGMADPFDSVGFQCVELSERYFWVVYGKYVSGAVDGADFVRDGHRQLHIPIGYPGVGRVPARGDIVSLAGGATDAGVGHTAVVASVKVNQNGNGKIRLMEENASPSGWGRMYVHHWAESYGSPAYFGSTAVSWLRLASRRPVGPIGPNFRYQVQPVGRHTQLTGINNDGSVTGIVTFNPGPHSSVERPFTYSYGQMSVVPAPATIGPTTQTVAMNNTGRLAISADTAHLPTAAFTAASASSKRWKRLPNPFRHVSASAALGINRQGDIAGWVARAHQGHTVGVLWMRHGHHYRAKTFGLGRGFVDARLYGSDRVGDAVGTETSSTGVFYPALWLHNGGVYRLPPVLNGIPGPGSASAIIMGRSRTNRLLRIVGSSYIGGTSVESTEWRIRVAHGHVRLVAVHHLGIISQSHMSVANGINARGWCVGDSIAPRIAHGVPFAFLVRPKKGMLPLNLMLLDPSHWTIVDATAINGAGQIAANGYRTYGGTRRGPTRGLLLTPVSRPGHRR